MAPLLQPADSCVLLIDPRRQHLDRLDPQQQNALTQALALVEQAVQAASVPMHVAFRGHAPDPQRSLARLDDTTAPRVHELGDSGPFWSHSGLADALAAEGRASLILCGFWLETAVTFVALPALAGGFDVFVLLDAAPARGKDAHGPAVHRLVQAGAVPTTTQQLVVEWIEASADTSQRSALSRLVPAD
jgi:nicotinamidase-related amidase